ncbi:FadR/GntR family transcriptional regulator [Paenochrobactrum sp. BZR 588]|uniref:FadR/GntR family transcriptional regulator n=1 Tax=Paenochrobactrum TaxID=999488 RepID=UPI0035BBA0B2
MSDLKNDLTVENSADTTTPRNITRQIADDIRDSILNGDLKIGERLLTEEELAEHYGVSGPTIREVLKRLAAQHLVRSKRGPGGGTFVNRPSFEQARENMVGIMMLLSSLGSFSLVDIAEFRHDTGLICLSYAVQRRTDEDLINMEKLLLQQEDASISDVDFCAADVGFHQAIAAATGNGVYSFFLQGLLEVLIPPANMVMFKFRDRMIICGLHRRILMAIYSRNIRAAEEAFIELMDYLRVKYAEAQDWRSSHEAAK